LSLVTDSMFLSPNCRDSIWRALVSESDWIPIFVVKVPDLGTTHLTVATNDFSLWVTSLIFILRNRMRAVSYCYLFDFWCLAVQLYSINLANLNDCSLHTLLHTNFKLLIYIVKNTENNLIIRWCRVRLTGGAPVFMRLTAMWAVFICSAIFGLLRKTLALGQEYVLFNARCLN